MKIDFLADTNFLIYLHEGNPIVEPFLGYNFGISIITEIELLGYKNINKSELSLLQLLINDCFLINLEDKIKLKTIELKQKYSIKLPDSVIAATSLIYKIPLVSADKGFSNIEELDFILL